MDTIKRDDQDTEILKAALESILVLFSNEESLQAEDRKDFTAHLVTKISRVFILVFRDNQNLTWLERRYHTHFRGMSEFARLLRSTV